MSPAWFAHPEWLAPLGLLWAAVGLALVAALRVAAHRRRRLGAGIASRVGAGIASRVGGRVGDLALWLALGLVALALVGPRVAERVVRLPATGVDLVLLFDVSRSMDAVDVAPSRLARAQRAALEILARLESSDRVALAAFAGRGVLLTPLSPDRDVIAELLPGLDSALVAPASSRIDEGVRAALEAFEAASERPRVVLLLSDGEDPGRRRDLGIGLALRGEARVVVAGFGSEVGSTLDDHGVPLLDASGHAIVTRRDLERLERLALETGGALFAADAWGDIDFEAAAAEIRRDAGAAAGEIRRDAGAAAAEIRRNADSAAVQPASDAAAAQDATRLRHVRSVPIVPLAAAAFALLLAEGLPRPRELRRPRRSAAPALAALALAAIAAVPAPAGDAGLATLAELEAQALGRSADPRQLVELGIARLERGQRDAAARAFLAAALSAEDAHSASIAYYDLGIAALEQGDYAAARAAFLDALALAPGDPRARFNLEWTLEAMAQRPQPVPEPERDESAPEPPPPPLPEPPPDSMPEAGAPESAPPELDEEQRRWLERVRDDPARALRAAAAEGSPAARRGGGPVW